MHDDPAPRLRALLQQSCSVADMRALVRDLPGELALHLPEGPVRPAEFASELVLLLERHHALDATFFRALLALRPRRRAEILALADDHGCTELAGIPTAHAPDVVPRTHVPRRSLGALAVLSLLTSAALLTWPLVRSSDAPEPEPPQPPPAAEHDEPPESPDPSPSARESNIPQTARAATPAIDARPLDACARLRGSAGPALTTCASEEGLSPRESSVELSFTPGTSRVTLTRRPDEPTLVACIEKAVQSAAKAMPSEPAKKKYTCTLSP